MNSWNTRVNGGQKRSDNSAESYRGSLRRKRLKVFRVEVEAGLPPSYLPTINNISLDTSASPGKKLGWNGRTAVSVRECRGRVRTMLDPALFIAASANWRYTTVSAPPGSPRR